MHQIQLTDQLYQEAQLRAAEAGFGSVDEYVADVLRHDLHEETEDLGHLFTPERLAHIDRAAAEIRRRPRFNVAASRRGPRQAQG